ncbi:MAG: hypothetical protein GXZ11_05175 [Tissierellia bacterium]|nr:hypothetical protein [Tissierellia bacterium]
MKKFWLIFIIVFALALTACGSAKTEEKVEETATEQTSEGTQESTIEKEFTKEQLKEFNGKEGKAAYIAVDGVVYDVTGVPQWKDGGHNGFEAGNDLTKEINEVSPHGVSKLKDLTVVGKLVD